MLTRHLFRGLLWDAVLPLRTFHSCCFSLPCFLPPHDSNFTSGLELERPSPPRMFIPLKDLNPRRTFPFINILLILTNVVVFFFYQRTMPPAAFLANATIPARLPAFLAGHIGFTPTFLPLLTSMFLHGNIMHLLGNMLFLWIFGDNVEDYFGHLGYFLFYLFCGIGSGLAHIFFNWGSHVPALGASGAISAVMGAYLVLYPRAKVLTLVIIFLIEIPAVFILVFWFLIQFLEGIGSVGTVATGGVAWWAHIGGFLLGMFVTLVARSR